MSLATVNIMVVLPEIVVSVMACLILVLDLYLPVRFRIQTGFVLTLGVLLAATLIILFSSVSITVVGLNGLVVRDRISDLLKCGICLISAGVFLYGRRYAIERGFWRGEYLALGLLGVVGMMIMTAANHLLTVYVGVELLALCLYAMVGMQRDSVSASEAAMKLFILGALASGVLLYGMSLLYGLTGTLMISDISAAVNRFGPPDLPLLLALILIVVGLLFKIGAVPFHMWGPDVYDGAPTSTTLFLAAAPKLAACAMILRLLAEGLDGLFQTWQEMLIAASLFSIVLGNVVAIAQTNIKRMLAYSAISHMGFFLLGILSGGTSGYSAALVYILIYGVITLGVFGVVLGLSRNGTEADQIEHYKGLNSTHPWLAFLMLLLMFSLAGLPPTIGFYAKLSVLQSVIQADLAWVAVVAVIFAVVGAFYYLRVVKIMYFEPPPNSDEIQLNCGNAQRMVLSLNALAVIVAMPWIGILVDICNQAVASLQ
ncbi:MAG: NADH-quinone oxidoreductase subunit NuoN [Pseudomonadota bacterium]|nr:NADH-quinone oxidoreductase subunit NuoN [Pseudomonadota bacterium]